MGFLSSVGKFIASPLGGAVGGLLGGVGQGVASYKSAQKQMKFQREMSNTAVQRQMADMRKAGINPILAAKYGGASSPTGASYSVPNVGSAAVEGYKGMSSAKQMQAQTQLSKEQARKVKYEVENMLPQQWQKLMSEIDKIDSEVLRTQAETVLKGLEVRLKTLDAEGYELISKKFDIPLGPDFAKTLLAGLGGSLKMAIELAEFLNVKGAAVAAKNFAKSKMKGGAK